MAEYDLPTPKFESDKGIFKVTLFNRSKKIVTDPIETKILAYCKTPRSRTELESLFSGRSTIAYLMEKYVKPMIEKGAIGLTIPDKPKSKYQKYFSVK